MSKLLKLKQWLTIPDAAKYLTATLSEPVTEADIFRLALDGALTMSVYFVSSIHVKITQPIPIAMAPKAMGIPVKGMDPYEVILGVRINNDSEVLRFEEPIRSLAEGVFDLPMIGGERIACEQAYQRLTGGPHVDMTNIDGTFLRLPNSDYYFQIYENYLPKRDQGDSRSDWERREDLVWFPVGTLPPGDAVLVVRVESLAKLLASLSDEVTKEKPLTVRERDNLLTVVGVLVELIQSAKAGRDSEAAVIEEMVENYGEKPGISKRTLEQKFAEAKRVLRNR